jgi:hypothetical protein
MDERPGALGGLVVGMPGALGGLVEGMPGADSVVGAPCTCARAEKSAPNVASISAVLKATANL